jgi:hypothetical protein
VKLCAGPVQSCCSPAALEGARGLALPPGAFGASGASPRRLTSRRARIAQCRAGSRISSWDRRRWAPSDGSSPCAGTAAGGHAQSDTPRRRPGACASKPASDQPEPCKGLRYQRMYRHPCVAPQRVALRATVKQADGVRASAVAIGNRWLSLARGTLPAQAENSRKGHDPWSLLLT